MSANLFCFSSCSIAESCLDYRAHHLFGWKITSFFGLRSSTAKILGGPWRNISFSIRHHLQSCFLQTPSWCSHHSAKRKWPTCSNRCFAVSLQIPSPYLLNTKLFWFELLNCHKWRDATAPDRVGLAKEKVSRSAGGLVPCLTSDWVALSPQAGCGRIMLCPCDLSATNSHASSLQASCDGD